MIKNEFKILNDPKLYGIGTETVEHLSTEHILAQPIAKATFLQTQAPLLDEPTVEEMRKLYTLSKEITLLFVLTVSVMVSGAMDDFGEADLTKTLSPTEGNTTRIVLNAIQADQINKFLPEAFNLAPGALLDMEADSELGVILYPTEEDYHG